MGNPDGRSEGRSSPRDGGCVRRGGPGGLRRHLRRYQAVYLVLLLGTLLTLITAVYVARMLQGRDARRFDDQVNQVVRAVDDRMTDYVDVLHATRGLFAASDRVNREEFETFVAALRLSARYPGIQGVGWAVVVPASRLEQHEAAVRSQGFSGYRVWPEGERDPYTAILFLEPFDWRNQRAFGYDMFEEPIRREAMERARDTGEPAASGPVVLVQEAGADRQMGFLVYAPVYEQGVPRTLQGRRESLLGWTYAPFRSEDLFLGIFPHAGRSLVDFDIHASGEPEPDSLLFSTGPRHEEEVDSAFFRIVKLPVAGRPWSIRVYAAAAFQEPSSALIPLGVLFVGLTVSLFISWLVRKQVVARDLAEGAGKRAAFLATVGESMGRSLDLQVTLDELVHLGVPILADLCSVAMRDDTGQPRIVALAHADPAVEARIRSLRERLPPSLSAPVGIASVLRTGKAELHPQVPGTLLEAAAQNPELVAAGRALAIRSGVYVPLKIRGETVGVLSFLRTAASRPHDRIDLELAEEVAQRAAQAVDNARLYDEAQRAVHLRDEFLSIASHELKTPLTSLHLQAQSLIRMVREGRTPSAELVDRKVSSVDRQVGRLNVLINELLDVSQISSGRLNLYLEDVDLAAVVHEVLEQFEDDLRRLGSALVTRIEAPVVGQWDRMRLEQVVVNLLSNAMKYGAGRPVYVSASLVDGHAVLAVQDRGVGIAAEDLNRIFERFERAVPMRHYSGLGLGLWIVHQIVEGLGGAIEVDSALGRGSTFTVRLPIRPPSDLQQATPSV